MNEYIKEKPFMQNNRLISSLCILGSFAGMLREEDDIAGENFCKRHKIAVTAKMGEHETPLDTNDGT